MCTVILGVGVHPTVPLVVAANRDEFYDRPSAPPAVFHPSGNGPLFGPRDLRRGGTWIAVNPHGVVAVLTNAAPPDRAPIAVLASRGDVIAQVLGASSAETAARRAESIDASRMRPFYLVLGDIHGAFGVALDGPRYRSTALTTGIHVQENRPLDSPDAEKVCRGLELTAALERWPADQLVSRLHAALADHDPGETALRRLCVHTEVYGTRSVSVVLLGRDRWSWWYGDGHACQARMAVVDGFGGFLGV